MQKKLFMQLYFVFDILFPIPLDSVHDRFYITFTKHTASFIRDSKTKVKPVKSYFNKSNAFRIH